MTHHPHPNERTPGTAGATGAGHDIDADTDRPIGEIISELSQEASTLFRQELELAKIELKHEATKAGKAGGLLAGGAVLGHVALLLLTFAAAWGLAEIMPTGLAFLIIAVIVGAIAGLLAMIGKKKFREVDPTPHTTIQALQEDKEWFKETTNP